MCIRDRLRTLDRTVRSVCPYCGVGCQLDLEVEGNAVVHVRSPWIEENTPNQGSTCVKGRFGTDFVLHRDRLTTPLARRGWVNEHGRWRVDGRAEDATRGPRRGGPWDSTIGEGGTSKRRPRTNPLNTAPTGPA